MTIRRDKYAGVKTCHWCRRKAFYHHGDIGACSIHRDHVRDILMRRVKRLDKPLTKRYR